MMMRRTNVLKSLLSWIAVLVMVFAIQLYASSGMIDGGKAPELQGLLVNGKPFARLDTLPKPALIYFWASWCGICRAMQSTVTELARDFPLITVATQSGDDANVREYMAVHQFEVQTLLDPEGGLGKTYGIRGVPAASLARGALKQTQWVVVNSLPFRSGSAARRIHRLRSISSRHKSRFGSVLPG